MNGYVNCGSHGKQLRTRVCQHLVASLHTNVAVGFHWFEGDTNPHPDAWCSACDEAMPSDDGEWTEDLKKQVGISDLCCSCYERAKEIWQCAGGRDI
jgi:hypothetical protein